MDQYNINIDKLTKEAENGQGHAIRQALDKVPFEEKIRIAHQMTNLNKDHNKAIGYPKIEFYIKPYCADTDSENGYTNIKLYRRMPRGDWGPFFTKEELLYQDNLNLTTGEQKITDSDF